MSDREALKGRIDDLSPMGVRFVARMVDSLADPPLVQFPESEPTWITAEPDWVEYFGLMISAHHGITVEALGLTSFETAFRNTCEAVDWALDPPGSATQRFVDVTVEVPDGRERRLSLKSTAAKLALRISAGSDGGEERPQFFVNLGDPQRATRTVALQRLFDRLPHGSPSAHCPSARRENTRQGTMRLGANWPGLGRVRFDLVAVSISRSGYAEADSCRYRLSDSIMKAW